MPLGEVEETIRVADGGDEVFDVVELKVKLACVVQSSRAEDYVSEFNTRLAPWRREPAIREFIHRTRTELGVAA